MSGVKRCSQCREPKPLASFYWLAPRSRHASRCKDCEKRAVLQAARMRRLPELSTERLAAIRGSLVDKLRLIQGELELRAEEAVWKSGRRS